MRTTGFARAGTWSGPSADVVELDYDHRHRRRIRLTTQAGAALLLDLPEPAHLRDGDALLREDGAPVLVRAAPEPVLDIHAHAPADLLRIAWHLGNRHLPVQLLGDALRIRADHVIAAMVTQLGGHVTARAAPFDPEAGAYAAPADHHHDHHHPYDHDHADG